MEDNDIRRSFASNLARLLSETGIKQVDIARRLHVSEGAVSAWCSGAKIPRMDKIDQLAALFNVSRSYLLEKHAPLPSNNAHWVYLYGYRTIHIVCRFILTVYSGVYYNLPGCSNARGDFQKNFKKLLTIIR